MEVLVASVPTAGPHIGSASMLDGVGQDLASNATLSPLSPPLSPAAVGLPHLDMGAAAGGTTNGDRNAKGCSIYQSLQFNESAFSILYNPSPLIPNPFGVVGGVCVEQGWDEEAFLTKYREMMGLPTPLKQKNKGIMPCKNGEEVESDDESYGSFTTGGGQYPLSENDSEVMGADVQTMIPTIAQMNVNNADSAAAAGYDKGNWAGHSGVPNVLEGHTKLQTHNHNNQDSGCGNQFNEEVNQYSGSKSNGDTKHVFGFLSSVLASDGHADSSTSGTAHGLGLVSTKSSSRASLTSTKGLSKADVLLERCLVALHAHENRSVMLRLLRDAKGSMANRLQSNHDSYGGSIGDNIHTFPLNYAAFEALTICFLEMLQVSELIS